MTITTFDWCKLDITKASEVRSDVDKILGLLPSADAGTLKSLSHQIQERIHEIELFCTKCNDDERSILFEKQKQRLRKGLSQYASASEPSSTTPVRAPARAQHHSAVHTANNETLVTTHTHPKEALNAQSELANESSFEANTTAFNKSGSAKGKGDLSSLYSWEKPGKLERKRILLHGSSYVPSTTDGIYMREVRMYHESGNVDGSPSVVKAIESLPSNFTDVQIMLTPDEFHALVARNKIATRSDLKLKNDYGQSLLSSTPYIDPKRMGSNHYRPTKPEVWTTKEDFRPNKL